MDNLNRTIIITNISGGDADKNQIRIKKDFKFLFPAERIGTPINHDLEVRFNMVNYKVVYAIGSHDKRERSGILRLGKELFKDLLKLKKGQKVKISKAVNDVYLIQKV